MKSIIWSPLQIAYWKKISSSLNVSVLK